jgi:hypothetical protein
MKLHEYDILFIRYYILIAQMTSSQNICTAMQHRFYRVATAAGISENGKNELV